MREESATAYNEHLIWSNTRVRNLAGICLAALTAGIIISLLNYSSHIKFNIAWELLPTYHTAFSIALLIGMAGLYFHASRFYYDSFYLFIAIGWLLNLAYILFINSSIGRADMGGPNFRSFTLLLALLSDLPFYLAGCTKIGKEAEYKDLLLPFGTICIWAFIYLYPFDPFIKYQAHTLVAISFATYVSFKVYFSFRSRVYNTDIDSTDDTDVREEEQKRSNFPRKLLLYDFLALAVIQLSFIVILFEGTRMYILSMLYVALLLKIINAYALTITLREDYADIRAKAEMSEEKLRQERQERSEFEEIGLLTASIEHELRTPLGVVRSKLDDMGRKYQHLDDVKSDVAFLQKQRERLLNATRVIKTLRAGHEFFNKRLTTVNLNQLARNAVKDLKKELNADNIAFKYEEKIGSPSAIAHQQLLEQAVVNILKNAVESINAKKSKGGEIIITIAKSKISNNYLIMEFKDDGVGFPEGSLERLTQPDFSTKEAESPNRGLGLFVCERIIKLHNGTLEFRVPEEGGAIVSICVPRAATKKEKKKQNGHVENNDSLNKLEEARSG